MKKLVVLFLFMGAIYAECPRDWIESNTIYTILNAAEADAGLPRGLAHCVAYSESRFKPTAMSRVVNGYRSCGIMQLYRRYIVANAEKYHDGGYKTFNWKNPEDNAQVGCRYLAHLIEKFGGSVYLGVLSYTYGETNLRNVKNLSDIPEHCVAYTNQVMQLLDEYNESWR